MPNNYIASVTLYHVETPEWAVDEPMTNRRQVGEIAA